MLYFLSFADSRYIYNLNRIKLQAQSFNLFDKILTYTEHDLDSQFYNKHRFLFNHRGYGYYIWKPQVVLQTLDLMNDGDILFYSDTGNVLNIQGIQRLKEYIKMTEESEHHNLSFELLGLKEHQWTKMDTITTLDYTNPDTNHLAANAFFIKKTPKMYKMIKEWRDYAEDYHLLDDSPSIIANHPEFRENRHDQSIFSILRKQYGTLSLPDETYFADNWHNNLHFPIHARRFYR